MFCYTAYCSNRSLIHHLNQNHVQPVNRPLLRWMSFFLRSLTRALTAPIVQIEGLPRAPTAPSIGTFCHTWHELGYNFYFTFLSLLQDSVLLWVRDCMSFTISNMDSVTVVRRKIIADLFQPVKARGL